MLKAAFSIIVAEEKQLGTGFGAKRTPIAIVLAVRTVASKAHHAFLQIALIVTDATMATFRVVHGLGLNFLGIFESQFS